MPQQTSGRPLRNLTDNELKDRSNRSNLGANAYFWTNPANQPPELVGIRNKIYDAIKGDDLKKQLWNDAAGVFNGLTKQMTKAEQGEIHQRSLAELEQFYRKRERENPNRYGTTALGGFDRAPVRPAPPPQQIIQNQYNDFLVKNLPQPSRKQMQDQMLLNILQGKY